MKVLETGRQSQVNYLPPTPKVSETPVPQSPLVN